MTKKELYFTIAGCNHYSGSEFMKKGMKVKLVKVPEDCTTNSVTRLKVRLCL